MDYLQEYLPFWKDLTPAQCQALSSASQQRRFRKDSVLHNGSGDCVGLMLVLSGQLRVYTLSSEGKELTLYRLFPRDLCLFSASCIMSSIQFEVTVSAQEDTEVIQIPSDVYKNLMEESLPVASYTNQLMASHFSDVMWVMDQVLNKRLDARLAALLLEEMELQGTPQLIMTHEQAANHLGSAREVVTRMLQYFQSEGLVRLGRGSVALIDPDGLRTLAEGSLR